jgi:hypothetical protein
MDAIIDIKLNNKGFKPLAHVYILGIHHPYHVVGIRKGLQKLIHPGNHFRAAGFSLPFIDPTTFGNRETYSKVYLETGKTKSRY